MPYSLRARLFLPLALLLACSIATSSLLSRRATLVEVREMVKQTAATAPALATIKARIEEELARGGDMRSVLSAVAKEDDRSLVLIDAQRQIVAGSRPEFVTAHVRTATADGELVLDLTKSGVTTALAVRGAPPVTIADADGRVIGMLYALPSRENQEPPAPPLLTPLVLMNAAVMAVALILSFGLSRQILRPVSQLKAAAERMQRGDLDVEVLVRGRDEIADLGRTFNSMASRLAETERLRRQLVSDVAHELRSPVTNLRCTLEAIQDGLAPADRASIDVLHEETLFLQRLISDLQDLALAEAGRLQLRVGDVNVEEVARRAAGALSSATGAPIAIEVAPDLPRICGDADRLEQVLRNLLSNARRHTPADGAIVVTAARAREHVRIVVRDTGAGIPSEHLQHVFDRFYRADQSRARATGGAGLGLAIARQLVAAHGGTIAVESAGAGKGTAFTIDLPQRLP